MLPTLISCPGESMPKITTLRDETRTLLANRPASLSLDEVAESTGLTASWLSMFLRGKIPNPGVNYIETLNVYLKNLSSKAIK